MIGGINDCTADKIVERWELVGVRGDYKMINDGRYFLLEDEKDMRFSREGTTDDILSNTP